jgi:hypothetical protein
VAEASYMSLDDYKNNLQNALPSIIEYYQDELGFMPSKEQLASAVKAAHATMERTGDTEQAGESLEAVLDSFVPSNSSNKNSPKIDFKKNLLQVLQQKYPDAEFKIGPDRVESTDGRLFVIADTEQEGKYVGCFMWDVSTGPYKGALGLAIKKTTDQLLQANPGKKPALFISGDNQNPEAWAYIAKKLKYKLITDEDELEEGYFDDEDNEPPYHTRILDRQTKKIIADDGPYESENEAVDRAEAYLAWAKTKNMSIVAQVYQPEHGKNYVTWQVPDEGDYTVKEQGVAEGAPIVVAQAPIHIRNPKKAPQSYRNQGDIVPPTKPPSTEKRGVKGRPGQRPMPDHSVAEGEEQNVFAPDIETQQLLRYAQQHYPNTQGKQQAFVKFVQRALNHSEEDDMEQDEKIEQLAKAIKQLDAKVSQVTESEDYLEEK